MTESADARVAVYIDFDNIIISRYDQVHGRSQFMRDKARGFGGGDAENTEKLRRATVDIGAVIDFASSFGTLVLTRAYADWSASVNADYRGQLVGRAVDLVQLFPAAAYAKNGADIRLAVDAIEDMFRLPDLTHVVIVAGDSDYIALAQRCKRLGRYVVGIGVAGSTSRSLAAACDEFATYDALPGVKPVPELEPVAATESAPRSSGGSRRGRKSPAPAEADTSAPTEAATSSAADGAPSTEATADATTDAVAADVAAAERLLQDALEQVAPPAAKKRGPRRAKFPPEIIEDEPEAEPEPEPEDPQALASSLLERALRLGHEKDDDEWLHSSLVKTQMKRMDPSFSEKALGFRSFSDFLKSRDAIAELDDSSTANLVRLTPALADA
ncbi:NYN domain-containing protein [Herbiconiux sp. VKM Ac-1786]|uniref:NYN domain-containing protein n=1 Tax=Herbiconiux sp. VKM Ac-1786 TaxID=2783824 RepID=UPI00188BF4FB|nr:NYN domain-containing protein [Herbiconiux sp. VKM Ac-1786]MBF4574215.1 NYN domain-containing protein [Herbiconiux sp. VKM Ac-1786]